MNFNFFLIIFLFSSLFYLRLVSFILRFLLRNNIMCMCLFGFADAAAATASQMP
jgi:hypothetical protein